MIFIVLKTLSPTAFFAHTQYPRTTWCLDAALKVSSLGDGITKKARKKEMGEDNIGPASDPLWVGGGQAKQLSRSPLGRAAHGACSRLLTIAATPSTERGRERELY